MANKKEIINYTVFCSMCHHYQNPKVVREYNIGVYAPKNPYGEKTGWVTCANGGTVHSMSNACKLFAKGDGVTMPPKPPVSGKITKATEKETLTDGFVDAMDSVKDDITEAAKGGK